MSVINKDSQAFQFIIGALIITVGVFILTALISIRSWYKPSIELGRVSPVTIVLSSDNVVKDQIETEKRREEARLQAIQNPGNKEILEEDLKAKEKSFENLKFLEKLIKEELGLYSKSTIPINSKVSAKTQDKLLNLSEQEFTEFNILLKQNKKDDALSTFKVSELRQLADVELQFFLDEIKKQRALKARAEQEKEELGKEFFNRIAEIDADKVFSLAYDVQNKLLKLGLVHGFPRKRIRENVKALYPGVTTPYLSLVQELVEKSTKANIRIDWRKVREIEQEAMESVEPVMATLKAGQCLATKGEKVQAQNYYFLEELNMLHPETDWKQIYKNFYLVLSCVLFMVLFFLITKVKNFHLQEIHMIFIVTTGVVAAIDLITIWGIDKLPLAPLATIPILLTVFYMPVLAIFTTTVISFFLVQSFDLNEWQILPLFVGSIYAIILSRKVHQREDLTSAGTKIALAQVIVFALTVMIGTANKNFSVLTALLIAAMYAISGWASGFISLAVLPYLESGLRLLTPFKLTELSNPNQALLKLLKKEAPGTYQHSLNVSRLSEEASNAIGTNTELIRIGLLYHDIGKTYKPDYFIENLFGKPNPHTTIDDPYESAQIIIAHVPEGIKLAKKYNLPEAIIDFIPMHQGKTITNYFYYKAIERDGKKAVNPEDFRYPGPSPQSKETGIAMMADSAEAALKSMTDIKQESEAKELVDKIIKARKAEGELSQTGLNDEELEKISEAFVMAWRDMNHERIKYPDKNDG